MDIKKSILIIAFCMLLALSGCSSVKAAPKLVNADFEQGDSFWVKNSFSQQGSQIEVVSDPERGSVAHILTAGNDDARFYQELSVSPDTAYRISGYVKTKGVTGVSGANIGVYGYAVSSEPSVGDTDWHYVELCGKTVSGQDKLAVSVGIGTHGEVCSGEAWFDDLKIEEIESATIPLGKAKAAESITEKATQGENPGKFPTEEILIGTLLSTILLFALWCWHVYYAKKPLKSSEKNHALAIILILFLAFAARVILSLIFFGHKTDINCFISWGNRVISVGPSKFYSDNYFCDYPPGYMLVLGAMSFLSNIFGGSLDVNAFFVKLPCIIADLALAYMTYRYAVKTMRPGAALALMAIVAFCPVMAFVSSAWGQIDQALALTLIIPILLLYKRKPVLAGLIYGIGIVIKPQALMCGPLFAAAYLIYVICGSPYKTADLKKGTAKVFRFKKDGPGLRFTETVLAVCAAFIVIILVSVIFQGEQDTFWLVDKYYGTATSYEYATVNAYNFWALIGANWKKVETPFMGLTYGKWGTIGMAVSIISTLALYVFTVRKHKACKGALPLLMAFMLAGIFTFGHYMHERYIFPALMLLMFAYIFYNDWRILVTFMAYAVTMMINCLAAFYYSKLFEYGLYWDNGLVFWCSLANMVIFAWFIYVAIDLSIRNKPMKAFNG